MSRLIVVTSHGSFGAHRTPDCVPFLFAAGLFLLLIAAYLSLPRSRQRNI